MEAETLARDFATAAHGEQKYGDKPYVAHLSAVRAVLSDFGFEGDLGVAAWLHDVLEDTPTTAAQLELMFGSAVTRLVFAVTGQGRNRKERNEDVYNKLGDFPMAVVLKLADRIANAETSAKDNPKLHAMYCKEYPDFRRKLRLASFFAGNLPGIDAKVVESMWARLDKVLG